MIYDHLQPITRWFTIIYNHLQPFTTNCKTIYNYLQPYTTIYKQYQDAMHWLPDLREKGIKPVWEADYEHLLLVSVGSEEEEKGVTLDDYEEGDEEFVYEEEVDAEVVLDDDIDLRFND